MFNGWSLHPRYHSRLEGVVQHQGYCRHRFSWSSPISSLSGVLVFIEIGDQNVSSFSGVGDGNRAADPTIATGDDGLPAAEESSMTAFSLMQLRCNRRLVGSCAKHAKGAWFGSEERSGAIERSHKSPATEIMS
jgi:hypothetical protein